MADFPSEVGENPGLDTGVEAEVPTHENSIAPVVPAFPAGLDSEPKVGDASC
jgi:hypothetical protein